MSLRHRLTLLYSGLVGGILIFFGLVVYSLVSITLINQLDDRLAQAVNDIVAVSRINPMGDIDLRSYSSLDPTINVYIQIWGLDGRLRISLPASSQLTGPLDKASLQATRPIYKDTSIGQMHLRVLSVPLMASDRIVSVLQVASNRSVVDSVQETLILVLALTALVAMTLSGTAAWLITGRALAPLETMTQVATQITRADDLSRRIPFESQNNDEITQLVRAFNETLSRLEQLFTSQRRFMADVSHELRTPLTVIKGNVALQRRMGTTDEESLLSIETEVDRLTRLVGDLLLLAQAESGKLPLDMKSVELDSVMLEVFQQMRILAGERLQMRVTDIDQIQVLGDRDRLKQVLVNLVGNAVQYTPNGGQVNLSLDRTGEQARMIINNSGPGIPAQDIPHIFERFYRSDRARTRSKDGSGFGLGLSIAYWIVKNHGGRIEVNSIENKGTTFCVWLPLLKE